MAEDSPFKQVSNFYAKLNKQQKVIGIGVIGAVVFGLVFIFLSQGQTEFKLLYNSLEATDAAKIVEKLKENEIEYELRNERILKETNEWIKKQRLRSKLIILN